jgi:hypothetical protein
VNAIEEQSRRDSNLGIIPNKSEDRFWNLEGWIGYGHHTLLEYFLIEEEHGWEIIDLELERVLG